MLLLNAKALLAGIVQGVVVQIITLASFKKSFLKVKGDSNLQARLYVSASGSSGTLAAGDYLKDHLNTRIAVVEATECPTLLNNGYGEHNIQGIGDKHVPLIHNVMNTDFVVGVSDQSTDELNIMFNTELGRQFLEKRKGVPSTLAKRLPEFGFSAIANILASIKLSEYLKLGSDDAVITVATDGADLYLSELKKAMESFNGVYDQTACGEIYGQHLRGASVANILELNHAERERIFNLGYYTWVEQQGIRLEDFEIRRNQAFWNKHYSDMISIDSKINHFNTMH